MSRAAVAAILASILCLRPTAAQSDFEASEVGDFRSLLLDSGISETELTAFEDWEGAITTEQVATLGKILFRLLQLDRRELRAEATPYDGSHGLGELVEVEGAAVAIRTQALPPDAPADLAASGLNKCQIKIADGESVLVLTPRIPKGWAQLPPATPLNAQVRLRGVVLRTSLSAGTFRAIVLTSRLEWYPTSDVPSGVAWLSARGFDAALLDEVRHHQAFAKPHESLEATAFYTALATIARGSRDELIGLAEEAVVAEARRQQIVEKAAIKKRRELTVELENATAPEKKRLQRELADLGQQEALAAHVRRRAEQGLSSVGPMFNEPERSTGQLFLIEGIARRAVRIFADDASAAQVQQPPGDDRAATPPTGLGEYYELDVFTADSQNRPVICCVTRLPEGFPRGEAIREPVRVAGVFFKKWAYARRAAADGAADDDLPQRLAPPLILAAEPQWLRAAEPVGGERRGLWAGMAIAASLAIIWAVLARVARRDRLARQRRARYDAPLDQLVEP